VQGTGVMTDEGFVVLKGSIGVAEVSELYTDKVPLRDGLIKSGVAEIKNDQFVILKDTLFKTPSGASCTLLGMASNGWREWKNKVDQTLDEVYRAQEIEED
jgi:hypothetical protein